MTALPLDFSLAQNWKVSQHTRVPLLTEITRRITVITRREPEAREPPHATVQKQRRPDAPRAARMSSSCPPVCVGAGRDPDAPTVSLRARPGGPLRLCRIQGARRPWHGRKLASGPGLPLPRLPSESRGRSRPGPAASLWLLWPLRTAMARGPGLPSSSARPVRPLLGTCSRTAAGQLCARNSGWPAVPPGVALAARMGSAISKFAAVTATPPLSPPPPRLRTQPTRRPASPPALAAGRRPPPAGAGKRLLRPA